MSETIQDKKAEPLKIKKPKKLVNKINKDIKVDLTKKPENQKDVIEDKKPVEVINTEKPKVSEEKPNENESVETPVLESPIKEIERVEEKTITPEPVVQTKPEVVMPENINKLVSFMKETGGTIEDYTRLNRDYSQLDENSLLREYYKNTKPHLDHEEISFIMEDNFTYDEEADEERDVKKKKLAFKEEIAKAKSFLKETKEKYYDEIKLRPGVTQDQQKAMDFFNRHNKEQEKVKRIRDNFEASTKELLNENFEGFDFNVGEKTFRYNVSNPSEVVEKQSSLSTFVKKFLNKEGEISDTAGYHKAVYAARNADTIAQHFYEQGKADAVKDVVAKSNNINAEPRNNPTGDVFIGGLKVRAINGVDSSKLKFKTKKKNN
tara:strand:- start:987 stop:2120 length:1134 start_codon:yes stop_codon:yes gene_type:complete